MTNKVAFFDVGILDEKERLVAADSAELPDLLRLAFSEEQAEIYRHYLNGLSLSGISEAMGGQDRMKIYKKLCEIKSNVRFLLRVKLAVKTLPRLIDFLCPPRCPFNDR